VTSMIPPTGLHQGASGIRTQFLFYALLIDVCSVATLTAQAGNRVSSGGGVCVTRILGLA